MLTIFCGLSIGKHQVVWLNVFFCVRNRMKYFLLVLLVCKLYAPTESLSLKNVGKSVVDVTKGVAAKVPDVIPSIEDIFQSAKNLIAGYPFEKVSSFDWNSIHLFVFYL